MVLSNPLSRHSKYEYGVASSNLFKMLITIEGMRAAIYARVSTDDKGQDVENQLMQLRSYCKAKGHDVYKEYSENITGTGKKRRPAFEEMMEDARKRKFDMLLVWSYDRFSRAGLKDIRHILELNDFGVKFVSYQESFLDMTSEMGELMLPFFAWIAKQEAKKISERTKAGLVRVRNEGKVLGRPKSQLEMERMLELKRQGKSLGEIAKELGTSKETVRRRLGSAGNITGTNPDTVPKIQKPEA